MNWTEICLTVRTADTEAAEAIANMTVPYGIYIEDYSDLEEGARDIAHIDLIDEALRQKDRTRSLIHAYLEPENPPAEAVAYLKERLTAAEISFDIVTKNVTEEDWANNWKQFFKPLKIGRHLLICPSWEHTDNKDSRAILSIDPGMAFGTGGHDTTKLVLESLEHVVTTDTDVLDVGCGSGILSMAALLLGAHSALGVDIDPLAVKTAVENGERNGMRPPRYRVVEGDLVKSVSGHFDVVVANIVADAIIALSPVIGQFLEPSGTYIVSGIIDTREKDVLPVLAQCGFTVTDRKTHGGWVCLTCQWEG